MLVFAYVFTYVFIITSTYDDCNVTEEIASNTTTAGSIIKIIRGFTGGIGFGVIFALALGGWTTILAKIAERCRRPELDPSNV